MPTRTPKAAAPPDPSKLKREAAGRYISGDGRFTVEQGSNGWMITDAEQTNEFGLPLVRGPFGTLDDAREAIGGAREGPAPTSDLAERAAKVSKAKPERAAAKAAPTSRPRPVRGRTARRVVDDDAGPAPIEVREYRSGDGDGLRALWESAGFRSMGDDDRSLRLFAQRNPGTFLVVVRDDMVIGSAMGGWDGRRGWLYHVAVAKNERRAGIGKGLVRRLEEHLASLGCRKVNAIVRDDADAGTPRFWKALGYETNATRQFGRKLAGG